MSWKKRKKRIYECRFVITMCNFYPTMYFTFSNVLTCAYKICACTYCVHKDHNAMSTRRIGEIQYEYAILEASTFQAKLKLQR